MPIVMSRMLSRERLLKKRSSFERNRQKKGLPIVIDYFHQVDDPYSCLMTQALPLLSQKYSVSFRIHVVSSPTSGFAPENEKLIAYSRRDAQLLASHHSLIFIDNGTQPSNASIILVQKQIIQEKDTISLENLRDVTLNLWRGNIMNSSKLINDINLDVELQRANTLRAQLGHYLGATIYYGGEWYWGIDRLYHLEDRLANLSENNDKKLPKTYLFDPNLVHSGPVKPGQDIDFFFSFRSPYSAIVAKRIFDLGKSYQANIRLRFVLPMVMRGLPVPYKKRLYISQDTAREAFARSIPFGKLNDPVGIPTERGLSLIPLAEKLYCGQEYILSFMQGVWSEGLDAGNDRDLKVITERCGMPWDQCQIALKDQAWRVRAENNRAELFELGLWGVPSFKINDLAVWGQDRLWAIEEELSKNPSSIA